jgi:N-acetyl-anhydromuramyl-L-alanine amidase AmpD
MIDTLTLVAPETLYRKEVIQKTKICLHFTAGYTAKGAFSSFLRTGASTPFIVERNGTIYQLYDPSYWDCHIFRHQAGEDRRLYQLEKTTIGIEVVNIGPLHLGKTEGDKDQLYSYTDKKYCTLNQDDKYVQSEFRGKFFWQTFTEAQYNSLRWLVNNLCERFSINPFAPIPHSNRIDFWSIEDLVNYNGVTTHSNFRRDKYDIGPAFDFSQVLPVV